MPIRAIICVIRNRETPKGDGNFSEIHAKRPYLGIRNRETPKGDGNLPSVFFVRHLIIRNRETPKGDGNFRISLAVIDMSY